MLSIIQAVLLFCQVQSSCVYNGGAYVESCVFEKYKTQQSCVDRIMTCIDNVEEIGVSDETVRKCIVRTKFY